MAQYVDASSQEVFPLLELERVYLSSLNASGIERESHITRFAKTVNETECGVVPLQKDENNQHFAVKKEKFQEVVQNQEWFSLLRKVMKPVRTEILEKGPVCELSDLQQTGSVR